MRTLTASYFMSLDGVIDAPQDWHFPYFSPEAIEIVETANAGVDALLMGRKTYEEWRAFWPHQSGSPMADFINSTPKFVASTTLAELDWAPSTLLSGDVVAAVAELKSRTGGRIAINGSGTLTRHLLRAGLVDELQLLIHPLVVGMGKHLFEGGGGPVGLELVTRQVFPNGTAYQTYAPAGRAA